MLVITRRLTLAAAMALALSACGAGHEGESPTPEAAETPEPVATESVEASESPEESAAAGDDASASDDPARESSMTVEELLTEPETFLGQEIFVTGRVGEELKEENALTLTGIEDEDDQALLVVNERNVVFQELDSNDFIMAQGTLVEFSADAMEEAGAELTPDDEALADYDGEHVLVASNIEETEEQ